MLFTASFAYLKPIIPRRIQILLRRALVRAYLPSYSHIWPIDPNSNYPPENWKGWPDGRKFALVITHDIDTPEGPDHCMKLVEIEKRYGLRSSFNFVAEGYKISDRLIKDLKSAGCEIGSHSIKHKNPFKSPEKFPVLASKINRYLKEWDAVGFRSPSMYHNMTLLHHLNIEYDASTFDTDPFEPQPDGVGTIFPFWVKDRNNHKGYVELPYTLPQDFLLFILLQQNNIDIWKKKLDWIAENGGMALFITHPDYMNFNNKSHYGKYPSHYYEEFLNYIKTKYEGQYWHVLPKDMARFWANNYRIDKMLKHRKKKPKNKIVWIDLDNTPHIPFFKPITDELKNRGYDCVLTARDAYQVLDLADRFGLKYKKIGHHYGKNKFLKVLGTLIRSIEMIPYVIMRRPGLAVSHGSRTQLVVSHLLGIPSLTLIDYEHTQGLVIINPTYLMVPNVIPLNSFKKETEYISQYPGIKEDVYVVSYNPNPDIIKELKINENKIVITIRPPATEAHYFCQASEELFEASMKYLLQENITQLILLPRNNNQEKFIRQTWPQPVESGKIIIPNHAINGLDLMWYSDLVISGGGTMNREAAALGVPVYSIFRGTLGAVDAYLSQQGRLIMLEKQADLKSKLKLERRDKNRSLGQRDKAALNAIVDKIEQILEKRS